MYSRIPFTLVSQREENFMIKVLAKVSSEVMMVINSLKQVSDLFMLVNRTTYPNRDFGLNEHHVEPVESLSLLI